MTKMPEAGPVARHRIDMDEPHQMRFWTSSFGVDERTLRRAIEEAGNSAASVRKFLKDGKHRG